MTTDVAFHVIDSIDSHEYLFFLSSDSQTIYAVQKESIDDGSYATDLETCAAITFVRRESGGEEIDTFVTRRFLARCDRLG